MSIKTCSCPFFVVWKGEKTVVDRKLSNIEVLRKMSTTEYTSFLSEVQNGDSAITDDFCSHICRYRNDYCMGGGGCIYHERDLDILSDWLCAKRSRIIEECLDVKEHQRLLAR